MLRSWKIGQVAGIDLYLHWTLLLMLGLIGLSWGGPTTALTFVALFACVLLHELGHALMARRFGIATHDITLYPIGGVARLDRLPRRAGPELAIALAGPAVNVALVAGLAALVALGPAATEGGLSGWLRDLMVMNAVLAGFNLIPAFPLDGGRVLRALLSGGLGRVRATEVAARIGQALALGFALYSLTQGLIPQLILAAFVYFAAGAELRQVRAEESRRHGADDDALSNVPPGYSWIYRGQGVWQLAPVAVAADDRAGFTPRGPWA